MLLSHGPRESMTYWQRWVRRPQSVWLRKAIFQLHLWCGVGLGLYVLLISLTGSVLVYRNELYRAATPDPIVVAPSGARLSDAALKVAATRLYPGYSVVILSRPPNPDQAVSISLKSTSGRKNRLLNPYTGADLGDAVPLGIWMVSKLLSLHDDLLGGPTGRKVNGAGAVLIIVLAFTGIVVWWPGIRNWRRSLTVPRKAGWQRLIWGLHSALGFWGFAVIVLFALSGIYLSSPDFFQDIADRIEPLTEANMRTRTLDRVIYWLAYLHFGRINGIGIPCRGPGLCDMATKLTWAVAGLAPAAMFATGALMWWNRVFRKKAARTSPQKAKTAMQS
jgi:uncharacterized iron-regulated membrane protein